MKITFDTDKNVVKVGGKTFGIDMPIEKQNCILSFFNKFVRDHTTLHDFGGYEEDSMWMSYRYCIGRHTIAASMRAGDIGTNCYGRMSEERSIFTAFDINREIENQLSFGCGPHFYFPITSLNRIYTSALDIFCQFVEDFNIQSKEDLLKYRDVHIKLYDNDRGYTFEVTTWDEYIKSEFNRLCIKHGITYDNEDELDVNELKKLEGFDYYYKQIEEHKNASKYFYLSNVDDLMVWNNLVHLFDLEHHHKSILTNGEEVEWYWTYTHDTYQKEDGYYYQKEIGYKRIRVPVNAKIGSVTTWIPEENIKEDLY